MTEVIVSNPLETLMSLKKIHKEELQAYLLFELNEIGREYLKSNTERLFMEKMVPDYREFGLVYLEGQRSVFKDIKTAIKVVNYAMEALNHGTIDHPDTGTKLNELRWGG